MWKTEHSVETTAEPAAVWNVLSKADLWPSWNPGCAWAHLDGPFAVGTRGQFRRSGGAKAGGRDVGDIVIAEAREPSAFVYEALVPGARLRFLHHIEALPEGGARVTLGSAIEGVLSPLFGLMFGRVIDGYLPTAVGQLAAAAEGRR